MKLSRLLQEETKAKIIWFLRESSRKYSEIMFHLRERDSGKLNYHLKQLLAEKLIEKKEGVYSLTHEGLKYSLFVDSLQLKEKYPLPVVLVAVIKNGKILLAKRKREPLKGCWGLPGNEVLYGQTILEAARSEIEQELSLALVDEFLSGSYPTIYCEKGKLLYHVMLFVVKARIKTIPPAGAAKGKISEYQFFTKRELDKLRIIPSNRKPIIDAFSSETSLQEQVINIL